MCVNFLTEFVQIGMKLYHIIVQVLEKKYHNDDNKKKKDTFKLHVG